MNIKDIKIYDKSFSLDDWETGHSEINRRNLWMSFDCMVDDEISQLDVHFDLNGTCNWDICRGTSDIDPDEIIQENINVNILLTEANLNGKDIDLKSIEGILMDNIKNNL